MKKAVKIFVSVAMCLNIMQGFAQVNIKGRVISAEDNQAIEFASVELQTSDSGYVTGIGSNSKGMFSFDKIEPGGYRIIVSLLGHTSARIELNGLAANIDLGDIVLTPVEIELAEVTVIAPAGINSSDKRKVAEAYVSADLQNSPMAVVGDDQIAVRINNK
jgi:hypothetical protein